MTFDADPIGRALVDAALAEVGENGVRGATTRAIASRAGVNEVTLFRRFGSKNKLIISAIADRVSSALDDSVQFTGDLVADLERLAVEYRALTSSLGPVFGALLTEVPHDAELQENLKVAEDLFARVTELLVAYQERGELRMDPGPVLVSAFLGPIVVSAVSPVFENLLVSSEFDAEKYVQGFLTGYRR